MHWIKHLLVLVTALLSLERNSPKPRQVEADVGDVIAIPHLGGLHHRYGRAA